MAAFTDSLRGYAFATHRRDDFRCVYCGLDGRASFEAWVTLSEEHLLPRDHPRRRDPAYVVTACSFCNVADNQYFVQLAKRGLALDGLTPQELIEQRKPFVERVRNSYREFLEENVALAPDRQRT
jgi:hypothetical protein